MPPHRTRTRNDHDSAHPRPVTPGRAGPDRGGEAATVPGQTAKTDRPQPLSYRQAAPRCGLGAGTSSAGLAAPWLSPSSERPAHSRHLSLSPSQWWRWRRGGRSRHRQPPTVCACSAAARMRGCESVNLLVLTGQKAPKLVEYGYLNVFLLQEGKAFHQLNEEP